MQTGNIHIRYMFKFILLYQLRGYQTTICYLRHTNANGKFYIHNNLFYSVISKIRMNLLLIELKDKNII